MVVSDAFPIFKGQAVQEDCLVTGVSGKLAVSSSRIKQSKKTVGN